MARAREQMPQLWSMTTGPRGPARPVSRRNWRVAFRILTVLLPALVVFGAEVTRHEMLHNVLPEMLGNVLTGVAALFISALILVPIYRRLEMADARLRATEIQHAVSEERERLARELHDGISQALFFLNVKATALERSLGAADVETARAVVEEMTQAIHETSGRVRDAIFDLRTGPEPGQPIGAWVRSYLQRFGDVHGLAGAVEEVGAAVDLPLAAQLHIMAIIREALHNVVKHARARTITVRIEWSGDLVTVAVIDDGQGMPSPIPGPTQGRYGLMALQEHARATGGTVVASAGGTGGTAVVFRMPYAGGTAS